MEKINKKGMKCSECGSTNTTKYNSVATTSALMIILGCIGTFVCAILPIFWIVVPIMVIIAILGFVGTILSIFIKDYRLICNDCKTKYKLSKEEYKNKI